MVTLKVFDWDQVGSDEIVGSTSYSKKDIEAGLVIKKQKLKK